MLLGVSDLLHQPGSESPLNGLGRLGGYDPLRYDTMSAGTTISSIPLTPLLDQTPSTIHNNTFDAHHHTYDQSTRQTRTMNPSDDLEISPLSPIQSVHQPLLDPESKPNWDDFESPATDCHPSSFPYPSDLNSPHDFDATKPTQRAIKSLLFKLDIIILPFALLLYLSAYLDRGNLGNAKLQGMQDDVLGGSSEKYARALSCFYITVSSMAASCGFIGRGLIQGFVKRSISLSRYPGLFWPKLLAPR